MQDCFCDVYFPIIKRTIIVMCAMCHGAYMILIKFENIHHWENFLSVLILKPCFLFQMLINGVYMLILAIGFMANIFYKIGHSGVHVYFHNLRQQSYQEIENTHI